MGYIQIPSSSIPNFTKAVISVWFRIPAATITVLAGISDTPPDGFQSDHMCSMCYYPRLTKIIPLITFGSLENDSAANPCQPSFLGVDCFGGTPVLACNLQTPTAISRTVQNEGSGPFRPGCFYMSGSAAPYTEDAIIAIDEWNHALISFDISGGASVVYGPSSFTLASDMTFTWSLNDVSKVGESMNPSGGGRWSDNGISDLDIIIPHGLIDYAGADGDIASYSGMTIGAFGNPIGVPASAAFVDNVYNLELAELQVFTGVSIDDAGAELSRRLFVDAEGRPVSASVAQAELGQAPAIYMRNSTHFANGTNLGTGGSFTPTGTIIPYTPGPTLT